MTRPTTRPPTPPTAPSPAERTHISAVSAAAPHHGGPRHAPASPEGAGALPALLADVVLVIAFVALGRDQHASAGGLGRLLLTASPFLLGLALTTVLTAGRRTWPRVWPHGVVVWLGTVAIGLLCRVWWGLGGAPLSFVLVTTGVLGVLLLGRRAVSTVAVRRRTRTPRP